MNYLHPSSEMPALPQRLQGKLDRRDKVKFQSPARCLLCPNPIPYRLPRSSWRFQSPARCLLCPNHAACAALALLSAVSISSEMPALPQRSQLASEISPEVEVSISSEMPALPQLRC